MSSPTPPRTDWLQRERSLLVPAGAVTLLGVLLFVASVFIQSGTGGSEIDTDVELLNQYQEHGSKLLLGDIVGGLGFICFSFPLYVLFKAAAARAPRVRRALVAFAFIGPVLLAIQGPVQTVALENASDTFVEQAPAAEATPPTAPESKQDQQGSAAAQGDEERAAAATDQEAGAKGEVTTTPTTEEEPSTTTTTDSGDPEDDPEEDRAEDLLKDSSSVQFARTLIFPGLLGLVFALVYIPLWSMRTGLLTRFWGTLGMALGVSLVLLPFAQLAIVIWFIAVGVLLLDRWPGGRPPAWDAGVAIPWTRPGDEPPEEGPGGSVEGQGREISSDGPTDVQDDPAEGGDGSDPRGGGEPPPRKRKRRR
jgi:hypothetical protein